MTHMNSTYGDAGRLHRNENGTPIRPSYYAAPNCDPDILERPPVITWDSGGQAWLQLESAAGERGPDREKVVRTAYTCWDGTYGQYRLVLVGTPVAAYLMQADDFDRGCRSKTPAQLERENVSNMADDLLGAAIAMGAGAQISPAARLLWNAGAQMGGGEKYTSEARLGFVLMLDALIASPNAALAVCLELRSKLLDADPELKLVHPDGAGLSLDANAG